jgi:phosphate transport system substrate-binding protein
VSDLVELYGGKRKEWSDGTPVRLVLRPTGDIDTRLLMDLSPALGQAVADAGKRPGMTVADTDSDAADRIERSTGTVGVTSLALALSEKRKVKLLKLGGVEPSVKALAERRYPVEKHVWMVTGPKSGAATQEFIAFVRSAAGRAVLERTGHLVSPAP